MKKRMQGRQSPPLASPSLLVAAARSLLRSPAHPLEASHYDLLPAHHRRPASHSKIPYLTASSPTARPASRPSPSIIFPSSKPRRTRSKPSSSPSCSKFPAASAPSSPRPSLSSVPITSPRPGPPSSPSLSPTSDPLPTTPPLIAFSALPTPSPSSSTTLFFKCFPLCFVIDPSLGAGPLNPSRYPPPPYSNGLQQPCRPRNHLPVVRLVALP